MFRFRFKFGFRFRGILSPKHATCLAFHGTHSGRGPCQKIYGLGFIIIIIIITIIERLGGRVYSVGSGSSVSEFHSISDFEIHISFQNWNKIGREVRPPLRKLNPKVCIVTLNYKSGICSPRN